MLRLTSLRFVNSTRLITSKTLKFYPVQAFYHSKQGVFGYKPEKPPTRFIVSDEVTEIRNKNSNLYRFICAYREHGHKLSPIDPLNLLSRRSIPNLKPDQYGLAYNETYSVKGLMKFPKDEATLEEIIDYLQKIYCNNASFEYAYVMHDEEREWLTDKIETVMIEDVKPEDKILLAEDMLKSQALDQFIGTKLPTVKRYGCEGSESMFAFFNTVLSNSVLAAIEDVQIGIAHRGRNNILIGKLNVPAVVLLRMMKGLPAEFGEEDNYRCLGDVLSHATSSTDVKVDGKEVHVTLLRNPSHLEAVNPVVMGKTRGRQQSLADGDYSSHPDAVIGDKVLCLQIHGDAAFAGQGVIMETLAMSAVPHCNVGGSIHLIINNQLGFTAPSDRSRSSMYCSDVMKMISAPVIHVNGDFPDAVSKATQIAFEYRQKFRKDVLVDLVSYRRWGHNELDDPTFTNPEMYQSINTKRSVPDMYADQLVEENLVKQEQLDRIVSEHVSYLNEQYNMVESYVPKSDYLNKHWSGYQRVPTTITEWETGVDINLLKYIGAKSVTVPDDFALHTHLKKTFVNNRIKRLEEGTRIDWATAEALAIGSLLYEGYNVRLCGQDVGRGTFSQRHAMFVDQNTNEMYLPLNDISIDQKGFYEVANSILSEEAVLGFEYGMSIESPNRLNIWEAQFGDFYNGAQIIIDTFICSGDVKWLQQSGLVMLLPHGFDGAGPDHSSSHIERFLQLCDSKVTSVDSDNVNIEIVVPSTPAQYFHLLRRQMKRNYRIPLIVVSPKILLRHPRATSTLGDLKEGTSIKRVISNPVADPDEINKIIFCTGQQYHKLTELQSDLPSNNTTIVQVEFFSPFPAKELIEEVGKYRNCNAFVWSQEEPQNAGFWHFFEPRFRNLVGRELTFVGNESLGAPAVGYKERHQRDEKEFLENTWK